MKKLEKELLLNSTTQKLKQLLLEREGIDTLPNTRDEHNINSRERPTVYRIHLFTVYGKEKVPKCPICKTETVVVNSNLSFKSTCKDKACLGKWVKKKSAQTLMDTYGVSNVSQLPWIKQKKIDTCQKNFGCDFPQQSKKVRNTLVKNNLIKYNETNVSRVASVKKSRDTTNLKRRGVVNPFSDKKVQEKIKATHQEKRGVEHPMHDPKVKEKLKKTFLRKYGCTVPAKNKRVLKKMQKTNLERFGFKTPSQGPAVKAKIKESWSKVDKEAVVSKVRETSMRRRGVDWPTKDIKVRNKVKKTNLIRYGATCALANLEVQGKSRQTSNLRYGTDYPMQNLDVFNKQNFSGFKIKFCKYDIAKVLPLRGYEPCVVEYLIDTYGDSLTISPIDDSIPTIKYTHENKNRMYFPDFLVTDNESGVRYVVEVKSTYTLGLTNKKLYKINKRKFQIAKRVLEREGIQFRVAIYIPNRGVFWVKDPWSRKQKELCDIFDQNGISWK